PAFGVSVSHNVVLQAALMQTSVYDTYALGIGFGGGLEGESPTPGYVDTLVFRNTLSKLPGPWLYQPLPAPGWPGTALAIANGVRNPGTPAVALNYPRATLLCDNRIDQGIGDYPPPGTPSTLIQCQ